MERIRAATVLADAAFEWLIGQGLVGRTEREVAIALEHEMRERGAQRPSFETIIASGAHGALPHAQPRDLPIGAGELVVIDWGAELDGYCSDCTRTVATAHAHQPVTLAASLAGVTGATIVGDAQLERGGTDVHAHSAMSRSRVAHHVGDRLLHDAVRAHADPDGDGAFLAVDRHLHVNPGGTSLSHKSGDLVDARLRGVAGLLTTAQPQQPEHAPHLIHRLTSCRRHARRRVVRRMVGRQLRLQSAGLDGDQREVVCDDVVELTRDPHSLLADGLLGAQLLLAPGLPSLCSQHSRYAVRVPA